MFLIPYAKSDWYCRNRCQTGPRKDHGIAVAPFFCASQEERRSQVFYDEIQNKLDRKLRNLFFQWIDVFRWVTAKNGHANGLRR